MSINLRKIKEGTVVSNTINLWTLLTLPGASADFDVNTEHIVKGEQEGEQ